MTMHYVPVVDEFACSAHGDCAEVAPDVFVVGDMAEVAGDGPDELLVRAAKACPAAAISIVDRDSGRQVYP